MDAKSARRRQNSSAASTKSNTRHNRQQSKQLVQPKSAHTTDPFLQAFLDPSFDAADYLNASLPPLQASASGSPAKSGKQSVTLADLSSEAQTLLTHLNSHTTRLSNTLTQLTDDILRSGSRLAYEVELLRGETLGFAETINETLRDDFEKFVPDGFQDTETNTDEKTPQTQTTTATATSTATEDSQESREQPQDDDLANEPPYIRQLRTLTLVRERLDSVIKTFGDAMDFVFPPSELSVSSSFLSVSAPEPGKEQQSSEEKGQLVLKSLRDEISKLLADREDPVRGIEKAAQRIEQLKELTTVWKGTVEEKGRTKFIESLAKMVEDRHRDMLKDVEMNTKKEGYGRTEQGGLGDNEPKASLGGYGLISQLQKIRSGL